MARYVVTTFRFRQLSTTSLLITRQQIEIKTMNFQQPNTTISTRELRLLIEDHLKALWEEKSFLSTQYAQAANLIPPLMIWGAPGVGKSTLIRELAQSMNIGFIDVRLAQREPVDMRGLPVPDQDSVKWLVSAEWPRDPQSRGIIMFDELTAADKTLQVAAYEFILDRRLGDLYQVPPGWYIVAAGNRVEDRAVSCSMSSALANRFMHVEVKADAESFLLWAVENNLHPAVINFIRYRPQLLFSQDSENLQRGWPSPRSWERVSTVLKIADQYDHHELLGYSIPGLIGEGAATEFLAFYKNMFFFQRNQDIRQQLLKGYDIQVPRHPDQLYACCSAISYYMEVEEDKSSFQCMTGSFLRFSLKLTSDFATMLMSDVLHRLKNTPKVQVILQHPLYSEWQKQHGVR